MVCSFYWRRNSIRLFFIREQNSSMVCSIAAVLNSSKSSFFSYSKEIGDFIAVAGQPIVKY